MTDPLVRLRRFLSELKRRNVYRVAVTYAVVAFVVWQVADQLFPALGFPGWTTDFVVILTLLGFPIALVLAWAFEMTPEGMRRTPAAEPVEEAGTPEAARSQRRFGMKALIGLALAGLVLAGGWLLFGEEVGNGPVGGASSAADAPTSVEASVAVLPFEDMSPEGDQRYFVEGLSEEILNALSRIPELKVAARTSTFLLAERGADIRTVADTLGVANVLEGSVRKSGNRVRITAQLIEAETGFHLWSETFDRELTDIFAIQDAIARAIASRLEITLSGGRRAELVAEATDDREAYESYLRGRYFWNQRTSESLHRAIEHFERAIELDPAYGHAHAGLADARILVPTYEAVEDLAPFLRDARAAAERALKLDPGLAEAHTSLAYVHTASGEWEEAERHFRRAIELNPGYATAHQWYSNLLVWTGRTAEGVERARKAVELDPLSRIKNGDLVMALYFHRRFGEAARRVRETIELAPDWPLIWYQLAVTELALGGYDEATEAWMRYARRKRVDTAIARETIEAMVRFNRTGEPQPLPAELEDRLRLERPVFWIIYPGAGQWDRGFQAIEESADEGASRAIGYLLTKPWDPVRDDPRYRALLEEAGLPR